MYDSEKWCFHNWKCGTAILLHACPFTINDEGITRLCFSFFILISDCRHLLAEYRSVAIDWSKHACLLGNFWSDAFTIHCLPSTVSVTVGRVYHTLFTCHRGNFRSDTFTMHCLHATCQLRLWNVVYAWSRGNTLFPHWVFHEIQVIIPSWWYRAWGYNARTIALWKEGGTVRPLPVPELLVKFDCTYRAKLWLRNPRPSRRLHN